MPTPTLTRNAPMPTAVHQPSPVENWLNAQAVEPEPYQGRHRGRPAVEDEPRNVHAASA